MVAPKGTGSLRERRPGVWEIRVAAGTDPVTGRTLQRSIAFRGSAEEAEAYRREVAGAYAERREVARAAPMITVGELLERWLAADHPWRPSTVVSYRSNVRALTADSQLADTRVMFLTPRMARAAFARWEAAGATRSVIGGRFRVLRSAVGWAYDERVIDNHPIRSMRGPGRVEPRRPLTNAQVHSLLSVAETNVLAAVADSDITGLGRRRRQGVEQDLLLVRLAADSGARRGELAALRFDDLDGRVLRIERAVSADKIGPTKSGRSRSLTVGASTALLWKTLEADWRARAQPDQLGSWLFAADSGHNRRLTVSVLDRRFRRLRDQAGVPGASLHRLRHNVATFLVARGEILQAQARLGHRDAATTLREYAYALPLTDSEVADAINDHLDTWPTGNDAIEPGQDHVARPR